MLDVRGREEKPEISKWVDGVGLYCQPAWLCVLALMNGRGDSHGNLGRDASMVTRGLTALGLMPDFTVCFGVIQMYPTLFFLETLC